jgi:peptide/nickel transport system substrate-binding protein
LGPFGGLQEEEQMTNGASVHKTTLLINRRQLLLNGLRAFGAAAMLGVIGACIEDEKTVSGGDAASEPQKGGTLRLGSSGVVPANFYLGSSFGFQQMAYLNIMWPLFLGESAEVELKNALAQSYEAAPDGLTHTISMRPGLTFHDGSPIDAEAVVVNYRSALFKDHPYHDDGPYQQTTSGFGEPPIVKGVEAIDELTLEITLSEPRADISEPLFNFYVINPAILARPGYGTDPGALRDAGSGPFRLAEFSAQSFAEFERFDGFFREVYVERLRIDEYSDAAAKGLALRSGEVDAAFALAKADHDALATDPDYQLFTSEPAGAGIWFLFHAPIKPELQDKRVREAMALAMNRPAYREAFFSTGTAVPSTQAVPHPMRPGYNPNIEERPYDPERARQLLAEAGVENLTLRVSAQETNLYAPEEKALNEAMAADLGAVGIDVDITITDAATAFAEWTEYDGQIIIGATADPPTLLFPLIFQPGAFDPSITPDGNWPSGDPRNDPRVKELFNAAMSAFDPDEQDRLFQELNQLEHDELIVTIPIANVADSAIARQGVHGLSLWGFWPGSQHEAWVEQG